MVHQFSTDACMENMVPKLENVVPKQEYVWSVLSENGKLSGCFFRKGMGRNISTWGLFLSHVHLLGRQLAWIFVDIDGFLDDHLVAVLSSDKEGHT